MWVALLLGAAPAWALELAPGGGAGANPPSQSISLSNTLRGDGTLNLGQLTGSAGTGLASNQDGGGGGGGGSGAVAGRSGTGHTDSVAGGLWGGAGGSCYSSRTGLLAAPPSRVAGSNYQASGTASITPLPPILGLALTAAGLRPGNTGIYTVSVNNSGIGGSNSSLNFYAQLPARVAYTGVAANTGGTVSVIGTPVCTVLSGAVDNGPLLGCSISLPPGGVPAGGQVKVDLQVLPAVDLGGQSLVHKAQIDPSSQNAVQTPATCTANGTPVARVIEQRFAPVPSWAYQRLQSASVEHLEAWSEQMFSAPTLEALLDEPAARH